MRSRINAVHFIFALYVLLDVYTFFGLRSIVPTRYRRLFALAYVLFSAFVYYHFYQLYGLLFGGQFFSSNDGNFALGLFLTALVSKLVFCGLLFFQDTLRLLWGMVRMAIGRRGARANETKPSTFLPARRKFATMAATGVAMFPFFTMLYGITRGKYRYTVNRVKLAFQDLPPAFEGFKIVQISDIHAGSLDDKAAVMRGVRMINEEAADVVLFTGDLVNSDKNEVDPYIDIFGALEAKEGKFSVLGNHDYYGVPRDDEQAERDYWASFHEKYTAMGFHLMNNTNARIERGGESIQLLGVENWGAGRWFPKKGDLDQALAQTDEQDFCILLSHDPSHWDNKVLEHPRHIHLTLSGHTHGFQFGLNMPGFKWSPAQYRYPRWMGLYEEAGQYLYVNRGFGFLAFPGRVGMWPEITVIELSTSA
ncbi:MAG: metallophosphoesterase [Bacteroidota bacterium]